MSKLNDPKGLKTKIDTVSAAIDSGDLDKQDIQDIEALNSDLNKEVTQAYNDLQIIRLNTGKEVAEVLGNLQEPELSSCAQSIQEVLSKYKTTEILT
jgi:hypothetical protein